MVPTAGLIGWLAHKLDRQKLLLASSLGEVGVTNPLMPSAVISLVTATALPGALTYGRIREQLAAIGTHVEVHPRIDEELAVTHFEQLGVELEYELVLRKPGGAQDRIEIGLRRIASVDADVAGYSLFGRLQLQLGSERRDRPGCLRSRRARPWGHRLARHLGRRE